MIKLNDMNVTNIQFFDYTREVDTDEGATEQQIEYSANIILDERFVIQLSGTDSEANKPTIPCAVECFYNDEKLQDLWAENLDVDDVEKFLEKNDIENNYDFLKENGELL